MDLYDVMRTTFAAREFLPDPIDDATLYRILDNARFAPSGGNRQGWHVIVIREPATKAAIAEAAAFLEEAEAHRDAPEGASALFSIVGHKADFMLLHLRPTLEDLNALERAFARTRLADFTTEGYSYVSVTELGMYEAQARGATGADMKEVPFVKARLKPAIPPARYMTFYPMSKLRGEQVNWYMLPLEERRALMRTHGSIGHKYFGKVQQMITGSVGLDDWEWGVTLFADDPLLFKKLVYEMRFDEGSARYALFGPFMVGARVTPSDLGQFLNG
ncbi:MAG: heme-dependent peroxidase [Chloroflexota bacterium]